ncbi:MAG: phospholipid carrier-dependent glycosyltransferase [Nitrospinales bacterium]
MQPHFEQKSELNDILLDERKNSENPGEPTEILLFIIPWGMLVFTALAYRPLMPIDETRYLSIAWEMWQRDDFLVPFLNGQPYSHKPPLLFWLFSAGWWCFGVNDWWPRMVVPLFGLGSLGLTRLLARKLWPDTFGSAALAPLILLSFLLMEIFVTLTLFDILIMFFTLTGILGTLLIREKKERLGWLFLALSVALGLLAKGPVIFLFLIPVGLAVPRIDQPPGLSARYGLRWYGLHLAAWLAGSLAALCWAVPAGLHGGPEYAEALLWKQTAGRLVHSFAHARPFWWYLALLPLILFPWAFHPPFWRALARQARRADFGTRLCLSWILIPFILFSLISGKQVHYLIPVLPGLALLAGKGFDELKTAPRSKDHWPISTLLMGLGGALLSLPFLAEHQLAPRGLKEISPWPGIVWIVLGGIPLALRFKSPAGAAKAVGLVGIALIVVAQISAGDFLATRYDLKQTAEKLGTLQKSKYRLAHAGKYHGQYNYLGRLEKSPDILKEGETVQWAGLHPQGAIILYCKNDPFFDPVLHPAKPDFVHGYQWGYVTIWESGTILASPNISRECRGSSTSTFYSGPLKNGRRP